MPKDNRYPCFMVAIDLGDNPKIGRLSDREFRTLVTGVWALAAKASPRGYLAVAGAPATEHDVAHQARCTPAQASRTLGRLRELRMLEHDPQIGLEYCHDWHELNPDPKSSDTPEGWRERKRREREKSRPMSRDVTRDMGVTSRDKSRDKGRDVTPDVTALSRECHVPPPGPPPFKGKGKELQGDPKGSLSSSSELDRQRRADLAQIFAYWQERCRKPRAKFTPERRKAANARLTEGYTVANVREGIDGAAINPPSNRDSGVVYDDLVSICRNGAQLERYMERAEPRVRAVPNRPYQRPNASEMLRAINGGAA